MIINFLLNLYLLVRLYQLYGENKLFTIQGLLLIFPIFYLSIPLYLYNIIDKLQIQNLLLDNINTDLIIYNINLLIFSVILISYMKIKRKSNTLKIIPIYRYILYLLFSINLLIFLHQLTYTNYSDLINFDRNALFQAYKSHSQNSYTFISRVLLIALAGSYAIYKNDIKYFLFLIINV